MNKKLKKKHLKNHKDSPSVAPGFEASAAKHRGQEAVKSTLCSGSPSRNIVMSLAFLRRSDFKANRGIFGGKVLKLCKKSVTITTTGRKIHNRPKCLIH